MKVDIPQGRYVVAVSGGVDSMVLLDVLSKHKGVELVVAHFDHGIRPDSAEDRRLVSQTAERLGLQCVHREGKLGPEASEETARSARYAFLREIRDATESDAIMTAHHQDDVLETAIWNLMRGTGRRGITSLKSTPDLRRPMLAIPKHEILAYAQEHHIAWREDSTNHDMRFSRNYIRRHIIPCLGKEGRAELLELIAHVRVLNEAIDEELAAVMRVYAPEGDLDKRRFIQLPYTVSREVMAAWLRMHGQRGYDRKTLERLVVAAKTYQPGKCADTYDGCQMRVEQAALALVAIDR